EAYDGPSLIIAYAHCIAHGINMTTATDLHKDAEDSGFWPLFRFDPRNEYGKRFQWETKEPTESYQDFIRGERRYTALQKTNPAEAENLFAAAEVDAKRRMDFFRKIGELM
ncbi:MAG: pyruvate:ferredoxin (flavodoxin) oxidoreductase, partial [Spirochaetaceae bacterium]|nr:pyruvate:ferredoxin (flavodoxin) oxidoreductase [Spirochaetaceae bacterium]